MIGTTLQEQLSVCGPVIGAGVVRLQQTAGVKVGVLVSYCCLSGYLTMHLQVASFFVTVGGKTAPLDKFKTKRKPVRQNGLVYLCSSALQF